MNYLSECIKGFEPRIALDGGSSGLETISKVIIKAKKLLKTKGCLFIEIGNGQSRNVSSMLIKTGFRLVKKFFHYPKAIINQNTCHHVRLSISNFYKQVSFIFQ